MVSSEIPSFLVMISYDLNRSEKSGSYKLLESFIEQHATSFVRPLASQWFIETQFAPARWFAALKSLTDADDRFFVTEVTPCLGYLDSTVWRWLQERTGAVVTV